jgi:hypothetical protein
VGDNKSGTVYDGGLRDTPSRRGDVNIGTGKGHQIYPDKYHYTRDPKEGDHWTDQSKSKGSPGRHKAPPDAK